MYGRELKYTKLLNWKGKLVRALFGETYPGHLVRFFINRRYLKRYTNERTLKILEMGSNNGALAFWLSRKPNYTVIGLENNKVLVIDCQRIKGRINRPNLHFICADAQAEFPIKINFDIIFSTHVLEHVPNDRAVLDKTLKSLKPGGIFILQVPYGKPESKSQHDIANGHVRDGYFQRDVLGKLENAGFEIIFATGSVGKIGRFAYRLAMRLSKIRVVINLSILFFPITLILIYLEQLASFLRSREPSFEYWPLIVARNPL